ncbi:MAG TPA: hypothetical protein VFU72_09090 [Nitrolancea sp.]|nr:hypothetical protein [Nitrolancea sp.]
MGTLAGEAVELEPAGEAAAEAAADFVGAEVAAAALVAVAPPAPLALVELPAPEVAAGVLELPPQAASKLSNATPVKPSPAMRIS